VFVCALNSVEAIFLRGSARRVVSFRPFVRRRRHCPLISVRPDLLSTPTILVRRPYHLVSVPEYCFTTSSPSRVLFYYLVSFPSTVLRPPAAFDSLLPFVFYFDVLVRSLVSTCRVRRSAFASCLP